MCALKNRAAREKTPSGATAPRGGVFLKISKNNFVSSKLFLRITSHQFIQYRNQPEGDRVGKFAQVQTRDPLDFVQPVHERVAMHVKFTRSFAHVQAVFEKFLGGVDHIGVL